MISQHSLATSESTKLPIDTTKSSITTQTDLPPTILKASKSRLCPQLFRFPTCLFAYKFGHPCPYSHSLEELREERRSLYH